MNKELREKYEEVIGLEVHVQLLTKTKAYSSDTNEYGALPNTNISVINLAHPGTLPRSNKQVFDFDWYSELETNIALYQNFKFGALVELDDNQFIPYSARFILGGSGLPYGEMLRGYPDNGIGPKINSGYYYNYDGGKVLVELGYKTDGGEFITLEYKIYDFGVKKDETRKYSDWFEVESEGIHQEMYEIASRSRLIGGSEEHLV